MASTLTAEGLALCMSLLEQLSPDSTQCELAFLRAMPSGDFFGRHPVTLMSSPDGRPDAAYGACIKLTTYTMFQTDKLGGEWWCEREATVKYLPDHRWIWEFK